MSLCDPGQQSGRGSSTGTPLLSAKREAGRPAAYAAGSSTDDDRLRCKVGIICRVRRPALCTSTVLYPPWYSHVVEAVLRALADESRRAMLEALVGGQATAGELAALLPIARPGVSRHLRVLREAGLVEVRQEAQRRVYGLRPEPLAEVDEWLGRYRALWEQRLDALHAEVARGKRERRSSR